MEKKLVAMGLIIIFFTAGLSGCQESKTDYLPPTTGDTDNVALLNCTIETYGLSNFSQTIKLGDGFIHNSNYNHTFYVVNGTIKNIGNYILHKTLITVNFYDENKTYLANTSTHVYELRRNFTDNFTTAYIKRYPFFDNITQIVIEFRVD